MNAIRASSLCIIAVALLFAAGDALAQSAGEVVKASSFQGGVAVIVGNGNAELPAEIHRLVPASLVHSLATSPEAVAECREELFANRADGKVTCGLWDGKTVPFVGNFVNLLVLGEGSNVGREELERVLAPGGKAVFIRGGAIETWTKPRPAEIDEWTHYLYGVDNNPVSKDKRIKPPLYHLQWIGSPRWSRHHDVMSSFSACVSADNRVFYIFDEGLTFSPLLPCHWKLIARDAFNGTILWKRDIEKWYPNLHGLKSGPATLPRRLVAVGDRVYATLGIEAPISEIDSATGKTLRVLDNTAGAEEILCDGGALYLVIDRSPEKKELSQYPLAAEKAWVEREKRIAKFDLAEGKIVWERPFAWVAPLSLAMDESRICFYNGSAVQAIRRDNGADLWTSEPLPIRENINTNFGPSLVIYDGVVVYSGGEKPAGGSGSREPMHGLSAENGKKLWEAYHPASGYMSPEDLFVIDGRVWCGDVTAHRWEETTGATGVFYGTDIHQGKTDVEFAPDKDAYWFHHRCHLGKATEDYLLMSRTGIEFVDLKNQNWTLHHWVRGACLYGIMPANGMIYAPQHPCACYIGGKLYGLNALVPRDDDSPVLKPSPESERLTKGDAHAGPFVAADRNNEWPTYRGNNARSGAAQEPVAKNLKQAWSVQLGGELTPPVIAGGKVLVSLKDRQALCALDETSGKLVYRFLPGGRIDSPPSVYGNRVYFGCTDGCVYCITLDDGKLVWKYQAAPTPIHHMYFENLEATHPVHGTVLVRDGKVYTVSGRSMFVDGGMRFLILDAQSGEKLAERVMDDKVPGSDQELQMHHEFLNMPMAMPDILSCNRDKIFMRFQEFDLEGNRMPLDFPRQLFGRVQSDVQTSTETVEDQKGEDAHIFSGTGFLDDSWWHRTYWIYGKNYMSGWPGYYLAGKSAPAGRILAHDADGVFGWGRMKEYFRWSKTYQYMLFATDYDYQPKWARAVPILVRGMLKAGDGLTIVGPEEMINQEEAFVSITLGDTQELLARQEKALQGAEALLLDVDPATGTIRSGYRLHTSPVFDGVASNDGRLFASLSDGSVVCYGPDGDKVMKPLDRQTIERFNGNAELRPPAAAKKGAAKGKNAKKAAKQKAN